MFRAFSKKWLINISVTVCVVFFGLLSFDVWSKGDEAVRDIQTGKSSEAPLSEKRIMERTMPPESSYGVVADKNLFSANRSEFIPEKLKPGPGAETLKISEKVIFLYGVVLMGDRKIALISNPESEPQAGKKLAKDKWVKVGDAMGNFSVTDIQKDRIILADGGNTHEILLYDKNKPARQTIMTAQSPTPTPTATTTATPTVVTTGSATVSDATKSGNQPATSGRVEGQSASTEEYKIVNTPFGPVRRRIQ
jgi:hypothetical protein